MIFGPVPLMDPSAGSNQFALSRGVACAVVPTATWLRRTSTAVAGHTQETPELSPSVIISGTPAPGLTPSPHRPERFINDSTECCVQSHQSLVFEETAWTSDVQDGEDASNRGARWPMVHLTACGSLNHRREMDRRAGNSALRNKRHSP